MYHIILYENKDYYQCGIYLEESLLNNQAIAFLRMRESMLDTSETRSSNSSSFYKSLQELKTVAKNEDSIAYNLYLPLTAPPLQKIRNQSDRETIQSLIEQLELCYINNELLSYSSTLRSMINDQIKIIVKYTEQGYGQAGLLLLIAHQLFLQTGQNVRDAFNSDVQALQAILKDYNYKKYHNLIMAKGVYPKYIAHVGQRMLAQGHPDSSQMIQTAIAYSEPYAFMTLGLFLLRSQKHRKAYEMFKNVEFYGYSAMAAQKICCIFSTGGLNFPKNLQLAEKYFAMSNVHELGICPSHLRDLRTEVVRQKAIKQAGQRQSLSFQLEESKMLAAFIRGQDMNIEGNSNLRNRAGEQYRFQTTIKMNQQGIVCKLEGGSNYCFVSLGNVEVGSIQNFNLLLKAGTRIFIKKGVKIGQLHYRVADECRASDIVVSKKYRSGPEDQITNEKLRKCAKLLFSNQFFALSLELYNYLAMCQPLDLDVIHCYRGLANQKVGEYEEAINCYKKSLLVSNTNLKAQYRISMLYIQMGKYEEARHIINTMKECDQRKEIIELLELSGQRARRLPS